MIYLIVMIWWYLAAGAVIAVTGWAGAHLLQLPCICVSVTAALPVRTELSLTLAGLLHDLDY